MPQRKFMKPQLKLELNEHEDLCVLGINSPLTITQLAYFLNKSNAFRFRKTPEDFRISIDKKTSANFTCYRDEREHQVFFLINNFSLEQESDREGELFSVPERHVLIDKKTDAWLCWEDDGSPLNNILLNVQEATPQIHCFLPRPLSKKNNKRLSWLFYE